MSPFDVNKLDDSSLHDIYVTWNDVNLLILWGIEQKFPMIPNPNYPLSFRPNENISLFNVFTRVWALPHSTIEILLPFNV